MNIDPFGSHCIALVDLAGIRLEPNQRGWRTRRIA